MTILNLIKFTSLFSLLCLSELSAAMPTNSPPSYVPARPVQNRVEDPQTQMRNKLSEVRNTVNNHESEIRTFENKLNNQEITFEHIKETILEQVQNQKDLIKANQLQIEDKFAAQDKINKNQENFSHSLATDLRQISTQSQEITGVFNQIKQRVVDLENTIRLQEQHIEHLEDAIKTMMDLIQIKKPTKQPLSTVAGTKTYTVSAGDVLEKIARSHSVSLQALREANPQITNDKIFVGQSLTIPSAP